MKKIICKTLVFTLLCFGMASISNATIHTVDNKPKSATDYVDTQNDFIRQDGRLFTASINGSTMNISIVYQENNARGEYGIYDFVLVKE